MRGCSSRQVTCRTRGLFSKHLTVAMRPLNLRFPPKSLCGCGWNEFGSAGVHASTLENVNIDCSHLQALIT